jgi:hypothetical protein
VLVVLAAVAVVAGVILAAAGRGGGMAGFPADHAPLALGRIGAAEVALLQLPRSLWGYNAQLTEEALQAIAAAVSERDAEIERLRGQLAQWRQEAPAAGERQPSD